MISWMQFSLKRKPKDEVSFNQNPCFGMSLVRADFQPRFADTRSDRGAVMDLHLLINEYFTITGRPISTMTVDEYLKFTTAAATTTTVQDTGVQTNNICTPDISTDNTHILNKEENKPASKSNESIASIGKKQSSQSMMSMLRSVSG